MSCRWMERVTVVIVTSAIALVFGAYEDNTHQALTKQALIVAKAHSPDFPMQLLWDQPLGQSIIAGAGAPNAGEDYTKYAVFWDSCNGDPVWRWGDWTEPLNHFRTGFLNGQPGATVFVRFYHDAVELWKRGEKPEAAFILGRAVHLIEDMAQPQHAMDEAHVPILFRASFIEEDVEANVKASGGFCPGSRYDYVGAIAGLSAYDAGAQAYPLGAVGSMARLGSARGAAYLSEQGGLFTTQEMNDLFGVGLNHLCPTPDFCHPLVLPFQSAKPACTTMEYDVNLPDWASVRDGATSLWTDTGRPVRVDLAMKLSSARANAILAGSFESDYVQSLLSPGVAKAAGVITAFWNEVKDSCGSSSAKESSGTCLVCLTERPSGENPDDSVAVKASSRTESGAVPASDDWQDVCRVGIGKGLPAMADYGISSSLIGQLATLDPGTDPTVAQALYAKLEALEAKYSGPQNRMPQDVAKAPQVAVWDKGFGGSARSLVEAMREPVRMLEEPQEPVFTDEEALSLLPPERGLLDADPAQERVLVLLEGISYCSRSGLEETQRLKAIDGGKWGGSHV